MSKQKVKMARKMLTRDERRAGVGVFDGRAWNQRKRQRFIIELKRFLGVKA